MKLIDNLFALFGYVNVNEFVELYESHVKLSDALDRSSGRFTEQGMTLEKVLAANGELIRRNDEMAKRLDAIESGLAQRMESMTIVRPGQYGGNSTFSVEVHVSYEMFEQAMDNAGVRRMPYEYDMMFNSLFRAIRTKFDALLSLGPKAWTMKPARRYDPYGQSAMEFYDE